VALQRRVPINCVICSIPDRYLCLLHGREWELSYRLGMRPWICVADSGPCSGCSAVFPDLPLRFRVRSSDGMPLGISALQLSCLVFQAEAQILMHPFHMLVWLVCFGGSLFSAMARFTSSPVPGA